MIEICQHTSSNYAHRTKYNASSADVTIALAFDLNTHGEKLTKKSAGAKYIGFSIDKNSCVNDIVREIYAFLMIKKAKSVNIAGNGIYTLTEYGCSQRNINLFVFRIFESLGRHYNIDKVYTGGQTGVDLAGAIAAHMMGHHVIMTLPNGFKQRFADGVDVYQSQSDVQTQVDYWCSVLVKDLKKEK